MLLLISYDRLTLMSALLGCFVLIQIPLSHADASNLNPKGEGCVDPDGYLDCYAAQEKQASFCVNTVNKTCDAQQVNNCISSCYGAQLAGNIGCWIQSCWNRVYTCEYQATAIQYLSGADLVASSVNIPFYPAPEDATGRCSCNLGNVYSNQTFHFPNNPCNDATISGNTQLLNDCFCCKDFITVSNIFNECPKSDLSVLAIGNTIDQALRVVTPYTTDNCAILDTDASQCTSRYGIPIGSNTFHNLLNLSPDLPGKEPLSNFAGQAFTDFGTSSVTVTLFPGYSSIITPVPFNENKATATGDGGLADATIGGTGPISATPTSTGNSNGPDGSEAGTRVSETKATTSSTSKPNGAIVGIRSMSKKFTFSLTLVCAIVTWL